MGYMTQHFKGKYRLLCPVDKNTNDFPKTLKGTNEDVDVYIPCAKGGQISYYGRSILEYYVPSKNVGNNIVREIYYKHINPNNVEVSVNDRNRTIYSIIDKKLFDEELKNNNNIIFNIRITDEELIFQFRMKDEEKIIPLLKPRTYGANISPFSTKNLPKSDYTIPNEELSTLKNIIENQYDFCYLTIAHMTNSFISSLATKNNPLDQIKADMKKKKMKGKEYIHYIGKWDEYINYLKGYDKR